MQLFEVEIVVDLLLLHQFEIDEPDAIRPLLLDVVGDFLLNPIMIDYWLNYPTKKKLGNKKKKYDQEILLSIAMNEQLLYQHFD